ncbi:hypothetical protein HDU93_006265 [Gonapodya sp. JEL0774]|nr:hypothetical protein HDU93_006265 [Gonapodya sp. JEL0774]
MKLNTAPATSALSPAGPSASTQTALSNNPPSSPQGVSNRTSTQQISATPQSIDSVFESMGINLNEIVLDLATESGEVVDLVNRPPKDYANKYLNNRDSYVVVRVIAGETESENPTFVPLLEGFECKRITIRAHAPSRNPNGAPHLTAASRTKTFAQSKKGTSAESPAGGGMVAVEGAGGEGNPSAAANLGGEASRKHLMSADRKLSTKVVKGA